MRRTLLKWIAALAYRLPYTVLLLALIATAVAATLIVNIRLQTDILALLPNSPEIERYRRTLREFGSFDYNLVVIEVYNDEDAPLLSEAAEILARRLNDRRFVVDINHKVSEQHTQRFLQQRDRRIVNLLTASDWVAIEERLTVERVRDSLRRVRDRLLATGAPSDAWSDPPTSDPLQLDAVIEGRLVHSAGPLKLNLRRGYYLSKDGRTALMALRPAQPPSDLSFNGDYVQFLEQTREYFFERNPEYRRPLSIRFMGPHIEIQQDTSNMRADLELALATSFFLVIGLFIVSFNRWDAIVFVGIPLLLGIVWTIGFAALVYGRLTSITLAFGAALLGLSIDFAIHIYNRFVHEIARSRDLRSALEGAIVEKGSGVITSALTTAIAFYGLIFTQFRGFQELGVVAGSGILFCLVAMLFVLPALLAIRESMRRTPYRPGRFITLGLDRVAQTVISLPRLVTLTALFVTAYLSYHGSRIEFNAELASLKEPDPSYRQLQRRLSRQFELPSDQLAVIVSGRTLEEALQVNDALFDILEQRQEEFALVGFDSLRTVLSSIQSQRQSRRLILDLDFEALRNRLYEEAKALRLSSQVFREFLDQVYEWRSIAQDPDTLTLWSLDLSPAEIASVQRYVYHGQNSYRVATFIYPGAEGWTEEASAHFERALRDELGPVELTGQSRIADEMESILMTDLARVIGYVALGIFLALALHFKRLKLAIVSIVPMACGLLWTFGVLRLLEIPINFMNIVTIPMIIGLGIDDGVHILQRYYERNLRNINEAIQSTGRAITISSLTTMIGFGALMLSEMTSLRQIGLMCVIGVACEMIAALLVLPALLWVGGKQLRLMNLIGSDEGVTREINQR